MSSETYEKCCHIEKGDVDCSKVENEEKNILEETDSCADSIETFSSTCLITDSQEKAPNNGVHEEFSAEVSPKSRTSSFDNFVSDITDSGLDTTDSAYLVSDSEDANPNMSSGTSPTNLHSEAISNSSSPTNTSANNSETNVPNATKEIKSVNYSVSNINNTLTMSTISLNEDTSTLTVSSSHSRSCDNLAKLNDTDKILTEFANQKSKVTATQKIPEATYPRIPKEILNQDVGSIVKNVQGIFSSVSGSLKNAYSYRTVQKPVKPIKPVTNGKIMSEIFEDEIEKSDVTDTQVDANCEDVNVLRSKIESLERLLTGQKDENASLKDHIKQQTEETGKKDNAFKELEVKVDLLSKRLEQADREKDAAVMRYASVECAHIEAKRAAEKATKSEKSALAEVELLNNKLKSAAAEKNRICQLYDDKCHELQKSEREVYKVREDLKELEGRLKWTQSKLRMEMDAYKESSERAEKLSTQITELEAEKNAAIANASDATKTKQLEIELKESQAALILCKHDKDELDRRLSTMTTQLDICSREREAAIDSLARTSAEVIELRESKMRLEEEAAELAALRAQASLADILSAQVQRETERANEAEQALSAERARAETCGRREAAALEHAAMLTQQHVAEKAAAHKHRATAQALEVDNSSLRERVETLERECERLQQALTEETDKRNKENRVLARKVAELTEEVEDVSKRLEWEKGENGILKKKHSSAIKELNRELQRATKRCEQLEAKLNTDAPSTRTGSVSSLTSSDSVPQEDMQNGHTDNVPDVQVREPDRQALIERIVSLQRTLARRAERCDFLEEHVKQLTGELRAKCRVLRSLLCEMPAGAVSSSRRDDNKKEIARLGGGAMAAVWGGDPAGMTLDLSLEMNKRLQAVLEDTLLKNITLKENMDTLGAEISRLKEQNKTSEPK